MILSTGYQNNLRTIRKWFEDCTKPVDIYQKMIEIGKELPLLPESARSVETQVHGCQSLMYLSSTSQNGKIYFNCYSDALISKGLAALLIKAFDGESADLILTTNPCFLQELGIPSALSPSRANGLFQIHLKMKQEALKHLVSHGCNR
jgi:cysteine desulfuration protein SufE